MGIAGTVAVAGIVGTTPARGQTLSENSWSAYRGGASHDGSANVDGPSSDMQVGWTAGSSEQPTTEPAIAGGTAYFGVGSRVIAAGADDGAGQWSASVDDTVLLAPALDTERIYVTTEAGTVYCFDRNSGEEIWSLGLGMNLGAPTAAEGTLYVGGIASDVNEGRLYAFDAAGGSVQWRNTFTVNGNPAIKTRPTAAVGSGVVVVNNSSDGLWTTPGGLIAYDPNNGSVIWRFEPNDSNYATIPALSDGQVAFHDGRRVFVLSTTSGTVQMSASFEDSPARYSPPAITDGTVITPGGNNQLSAYDIGSGEQTWSLSRAFSSATIGTDYVFAIRNKEVNSGDKPAEIVTIRPDDGLVQYSFTIGDITDYDFEIALTDEGLFIVGDGTLYAVSNPASTATPANSTQRTSTSSLSETSQTEQVGDTSTASGGNTITSATTNEAGTPERGFFTNGENQPLEALTGAGLTTLSTLITVVGIGVTFYDMIRGGEN